MTKAADTKTPSLYEVGMEGAQIEEILLANDGELNPELEERLDAHLASGKNKIVAAAMVVRQLEANAAACDAEVKRLVERKASWLRQSDSLKGRMLFAVDAGFDGKLKTDLFTIWGQTSASTISIDIAADVDLSTLKDYYPNLVRQKYELDKATAKSMLSQGLALPAAVAVTENPGTRYLRIK